MTETASQYLTITEAAKRKGCTRRVIYGYIERGLLNTQTVLGKRAVVNDEHFQALTISKGNWQILTDLTEKVSTLDDRLSTVEEHINTGEEG